MSRPIIDVDKNIFKESYNQLTKEERKKIDEAMPIFIKILVTSLLTQRIMELFDSVKPKKEMKR